ncbi:methyl-accepting chemotaxis protein WspA [Duganella sp. CF402]|uniref:methyl-accepting chemotaxis protein n=1 Tax=unclassified Duganella TaxID=2636909 RepID=UPI0008BB6448|nr:MULTISPECIES: methyl-accepting chemotaxis protein [unclassified Duganella]RZT11497.1 methyl-accepting chemotaxis protein WspA [Duganella sp. BK701]SEK62103.1 methyl-accepting chemotaxis protein WspA [Duganella sp. CF402]
MLANLSIKKKLASGFGAIIVIIVILLATAHANFTKLSVANEWDKHTLRVLLEAGEIETSVIQVQNSTRGFMLTGEESITKPIPIEEEKIRQHMVTIKRLTADNPAQQERLQRLAPMVQGWIDNVIHPLLEKRRALNKQVGVSQQVATSADVLNGAKTIAEARLLIKEISDEEDRLLAERNQFSSNLSQTMMLLLIVGGAVCTVLALVIGGVLSSALAGPLVRLSAVVERIAHGEQSARVEVSSNDELGQVSRAFNQMAQSIQDNLAKELAATNLLKSKVDSLLGVVSKAAAGDLTGQITVQGEDAIGQLAAGLERMFDNLRALINDVQKAGIQVTTSATEIAASAKQQEATGVEQAQTSIEILATTKEISANISHLVKTMEEATSVADYTTHATADAQGNLKRMDGTMQNMVAATDSINAKLAALSEKASNINSVLITITKVADQTNILSLNAAIEAEKAGEAGRGFSVVATEIRRLADQTSVSTWDIEQMLKEMQSAVSASVMGMDKFSEEIRRSVGEVRAVTDQLSGVMDQVQKLAPQFDLVLQGMQSQAVGASQINETMMQLNDATQQTVESLKSTSEAVHQLQYAAGGLQSSVATFSVAT